MSRNVPKQKENMYDSIGPVTMGSIKTSAASGISSRIALPVAPFVGASYQVWMGYYAAVQCYLGSGKPAHTEEFKPPSEPGFWASPGKESADAVWLTYYVVYKGYCDTFCDRPVDLSEFTDAGKKAFLALQCGAGDGFCYMGLAASRATAAEMRVLGKDPSLANLLSTPARWYRSLAGWYVTTDGVGKCHVSGESGPGAISARRFFYYAASLSRVWPPGSFGESLLMGHLGRSMISLAVPEHTHATGDLVVLKQAPDRLVPGTVVLCENRRDISFAKAAYPDADVLCVQDLGSEKVMDALYFSTRAYGLTNEQYGSISGAVVRSLVTYTGGTVPPYAFRNRTALDSLAVRKKQAEDILDMGGPYFGRLEPRRDTALVLHSGILGYRYVDFEPAASIRINYGDGYSYAALLGESFVDAALRQLGKYPSLGIFSQLPAEWLKVGSVRLAYSNNRLTVQADDGIRFCEYPMASIQLARACSVNYEWYPGSIGRASAELCRAAAFPTSSCEVSLDLVFR